MPFYAEGGRVAKVEIDRRPPPPLGSYANSPFVNFQGDAAQALKYLRQQQQKAQDAYDTERNAYRDELERWAGNDCVGEKPRPPSLPKNLFSETFNLFSSVLPYLRLELWDNGERLVCYKEGFEQPYNAAEMSDGERHAFCLLVTIVGMQQHFNFFIVDEPELNLNSQLACRFWDIVEKRFPDAYFLYATHDVGFAARASVEQIIVLAGHEREALVKDHLSEVPRDELIAFLGEIPAILYANKSVLVEEKAGEAHEGFDETFYRWLIGDKSVLISKLGGCEEVQKAVAGQSPLWSEQASNAVEFGIIDRDYRSNDDVKELESERLLVLDLHEAESYLCIPEVFSKLSEVALEPINKREEQIPPKSSDEVEKLIVEFFQDGNRWVETAAKRFDRRGIKVPGAHISIPESERSGKTPSGLHKIMERQIKEACQSPDRLQLKQEALPALKAEIATCKHALEQQDITSILRLVGGKELLDYLIEKADLELSRERLLRIATGLDPSTLPVIRDLREELLSRLGLT